jgi:hypothetical protein
VTVSHLGNPRFLSITCACLSTRSRDRYGNCQTLALDSAMDSTAGTAATATTSILTGEGWVLELLTGHPECIRCELGVHRHVFLELITELRRLGHTNSRFVSLEEQLAIFLYTCVTGLTIRHAGERFQRSNETISR